MSGWPLGRWDGLLTWLSLERSRENGTLGPRCLRNGPDLWVCRVLREYACLVRSRRDVLLVGGELASGGSVWTGVESLTSELA